MERKHRASSEGFGFVQLEPLPEDEKPKISEARPKDESPRRPLGKEAIDQTNKEKNNE
ncbi:MAG TPA: hypothetical protein VLA77_04210 [Candidatus Saccharimonadales bacterium]|nr:hypothetical protein [Candidatus Saccharimonadales bacterium]